MSMFDSQHQVYFLYNYETPASARTELDEYPAPRQGYVARKENALVRLVRSALSAR